MRPFAVGGAFSHGASGQELKEFATKTYESARPSGWDLAERIKDQEIDGVEAEVLYTTLGMSMFSLLDIELQQACFRVYNDWAAQFCSYNPRRLTAVALISSGRSGRRHQGIAPLRQNGTERRDDLWVAIHRSSLPEPAYDPFWTAARTSRRRFRSIWSPAEKFRESPRTATQPNPCRPIRSPKFLARAFPAPT